MCDDDVFLAARALRTSVAARSETTTQGGVPIKQYLFNFHVFIYTVADACWLPAHRLYLH